MPNCACTVAVLIALVSLPVWAGPALAQRPEIFQAGRAEFGSDLAAGGFDVVAYQTQSQAVPGAGQFRVRWKEAEWRFASLQNRDLFVANPDRYAPQFGGWCAFAVAAGAKATSDPRLFDVVNGRLFLNQSPGTQDSWRRDQAAMIQRGDQNWPRVIRQ